jgi:hypothetical protein
VVPWIGLIVAAPAVTMSSAGVWLTITFGTTVARVPGTCLLTSCQFSSLGNLAIWPGSAVAVAQGPALRSFVVSHESPCSR